MKVLVIGAAGKSGRAVVEQALAAGHDVTAFVHKTHGYLPDSNVSVIEGDARDRSAVDSAITRARCRDRHDRRQAFVHDHHA